MKRIVPLLIVLLVIGLGAGTTYFLWSKSRKPPVVAKTESAEVKDIVKKTVATGAIVPREEVELKPRVSGVIDELYLQPGAVVQAGAQIAKIRIVPDAASLQRAQSGVQTAKIALDNARRELARGEGLVASGVIAPAERPLAGLSALLAPVLCGGNTAVVLASEASPFAPLTFGEVLATSDVPAGVANLLVGPVAELAPWLADHHDVDALDISGVVDAELATDLTVRSADNLKRVARTDGVRSPRTAGEFLEIKTVWHPARL